MLNKMNLDGSTSKSESILTYKNNENIIDYYMKLFLEITDGIISEAILKGNILLNQILPDDARTTKDLDFEVIQLATLKTVVMPRLVKFAERCISEGLADRYRLSEFDENHSAGIKIYKDNIVKYGVDVSVNNVRSTAAVKMYNFRGESYFGSSLEHIIADKSISVLSSRRFRRMKDFYDLYIICNSDLPYSIRDVREICIEKVGGENNFQKLRENYPFSEEIFIQCAKIWKGFNVYKVTGEKVDLPEFKVVQSVTSSILGVL